MSLMLIKKKAMLLDFLSRRKNLSESNNKMPRLSPVMTPLGRNPAGCNHVPHPFFFKRILPSRLSLMWHYVGRVFKVADKSLWFEMTHEENLGCAPCPRNVGYFAHEGPRRGQG
jgi:hypothetical protein